ATTRMTGESSCCRSMAASRAGSRIRDLLQLTTHPRSLLMGIVLRTRNAPALLNGGCDGDRYVQELGPGYSLQGSPRQVKRQRVDCYGLSWSRDGDSLIDSASNVSGILPYLWRTRIDGREPPERLEIAGPEALFPSASLAASRIVFHRRLGNADIWRYHVN